MYFSEYDYDNLFAKCSCQVKECARSFADMNINKGKILANFKNIKNIVNFHFLICYKQLFNKKGILNNKGCYLIFGIIIFHIIIIFIFRIKQFSLLENKIKKIASEIYEYQSVKVNVKDEKNVIFKKHRSKAKKISIHKKSKRKDNKDKHFNYNKPLNDSKIRINIKDKNYLKNRRDNKVINKKYIDEEINGLSFNLAIQYDKRTYCQYYASLLKTQHNLICIVFNINDYNSETIKIDLFLIGFTIDYTVNALFYNDDTMHKIYKSKGNFDLATEIPITIYSTIISMILNFHLNLLALSNDAIINYKQNSIKSNIFEKAKNLKKILIIKFILYFTFSFIFLLFF